MATLNILRTSGTDKEILEKTTDSIIHLFISSYDNCKTKNDHEFGDILINEESDSRFALIVKEDLCSKIITSALRLSILNLLKHLIESDKEIKNILISRHQFSNRKEEVSFIASLNEFLITYFGEVLTDTITLIISDCKESD